MTTVGYQLQIHHLIDQHDDLGHSLDQLRHHLPQPPRLHPSSLSPFEADAAFESAYGKLDQLAARLLRSLGLLVQPCFSSAIAAVLLDCEADVVTPVIERLIQMRLVDAVSQTWYCLAHEVIRHQARSRLVVEETIDFRYQARLRVIRWYLDLCEQVNLCLDPATRFQIALAARKGNSFVATLANSRFENNRSSKRSESIAQGLFLFALDWFEQEKANLVWAVEWAYQAEAWEMTLRLTHCLVRFFDLKADWQNWEQTHLLALDAAQRLSDRVQQAQILNSLGNVCVRQGQFKRAKERYERALALCREQSILRQEAQTLVNLGIVCRMQSEPEAASEVWKRAIEKFPPSSLEREKIGKWMQSAARLPLETALEELGASANSHQILNAVGGAIKWLLHPGELHH